MLVIPDRYINYKLVAIDPGLTNTGVAIYEINDRNKIVNIYSHTIQPDKLPYKVLLDNSIVTDRVIRLFKLRLAIQILTSQVRPSAVICEGPFYSSFRPMAYGSLVETISYIQAGVMEVDPNIYFDLIQPLSVKKTIGAGMMKGKVDVTKAVSMRSDIMSVLRNPLEELDEHSIDAIAIGYSHLKQLGVF